MTLRTCGVLLIAAAASVGGQTPPPAVTSATGSWRSEPPMYVTLVLKADGPRLTGAVDRCSSNPQVPSQIFDGRIDGTAISFKCSSPDGDRTVAFTGTISGDSI